MSKIVGIDYGRHKIGLAIADEDGKLAEPYSVIRFDSFKEAVRKISKVLQEVGTSKVVVGLSEGKMANETEAFGKRLSEELRIEVYYQDETLTTHDAQDLAIQAGIQRKKRKDMEDAYAASLILQDFLDSQPVT